jgi:hypothetical protein
MPDTMLIAVYLSVCEQFKSGLWQYVRRFSNNMNPEFTDEEVMTIYLFGIIQKRRTVKEIYDYICDHFSSWFPLFPCYGGYVQRLNRISSAFPALCEAVKQNLPRENILAEVGMLDSFPVIMASEKRSGKARVASFFANKGYCSSKKMYYYGVKVHVLGLRSPGTLPQPDRALLTPASEFDLNVLEHIASELHDIDLFVDKAYIDSELSRQLCPQMVHLYAPFKKKKGQEILPLAERAFSKAVSAVRQPLESLFSWIGEKTGIEIASKVRSFKGLLVHVFGRLAACFLLLSLNR